MVDKDRSGVLGSLQSLHFFSHGEVVVPLPTLTLLIFLLARHLSKPFLTSSILNITHYTLHSDFRILNTSHYKSDTDLTWACLLEALTAPRTSSGLNWAPAGRPSRKLWMAAAKSHMIQVLGCTHVKKCNASLKMCEF